MDTANASMATESTPNDDPNEIFRQLEIYPWDTDKEFQGGLSAILGPKPSSDPSQILDLTLRAQCFYFSRKKSIPIDFNAYKKYLSAKTPTKNLPPTTSTTSPPPSNMAIQIPPPSINTSPATVSNPPPHPAKFQEIIALIQSGAPIPGIVDIPDTVLTGQSSTPTLPKRKKPWEKELPSATGGTFGDRRDDYIAQELPDETSTVKLEDEVDGVASDKV